MNGNVDLQSGTTSHKNVHDYKLLVDPFLVKGGQKLYRYDGIVPGDVQYPPVQLKDPRNIKALKLRTRVEPIELPIPRFLIEFHTTTKENAFQIFYQLKFLQFSSFTGLKSITTMWANHRLLKLLLPI